MLQLRMLDEIESGLPNNTYGTGNGNTEDMLTGFNDAEIPFPHQGQNLVTAQTQVPRIFVDVGPETAFVELGRLAASKKTLNNLQNMALQLVCRFLDKYTADPESASQHFQYTGG